MRHFTLACLILTAAVCFTGCKKGQFVRRGGCGSCGGSGCSACAPSGCTSCGQAGCTGCASGACSSGGCSSCGCASGKCGRPGGVYAQARQYGQPAAYGGGGGGGGYETCSACGGRGCQHCGMKGKLAAHHDHSYRQEAPPYGPPSAQVGYPYYTTRGPRDFLVDNPPGIGP